MKYQELVNVYEALGATTKRLEKTDILADFFKRVEEEDLEKITLMALGSVFPSWSEEEQGIGDKLVMKAVGDAVGVSVDVVEDAKDPNDIFLTTIDSGFCLQPIKKIGNNIRKQINCT